MRRVNLLAYWVPAFLLGLILTGFPARAGTIAAPVKLLATDAMSHSAVHDYFGYAVAVSGETALIGAYKDDDGWTNSGSAFVFTRQADGSWQQQAELHAADAAATDYFGISVAIDGDTAVVGAYFAAKIGAAYVFERQADGAWLQLAKLTPADGAEGDMFGCAVAISADTVVVGAGWDDEVFVNSGSAYLFDRGTWQQRAKLQAGDPQDYAYFGAAVAIDGDNVLIGANGDSNYTGAAYLFTRQNGAWLQEGKLLAADGAESDFFGYAVALYGETALIGAYGDSNRTGAAYTFTRLDGLWVQQAKLMSADGAVDDFFGYTVAISGDLAVIGARLDDDYWINSGSAYLFAFQDGAWSQQVEIQAVDEDLGDQFGRAVAIDGLTVVVGAGWDRENGGGAGAVYVGLDADGDGIADIAMGQQGADNCPTVPNADQLDLNGDGYGDACVSPDALISTDAKLGRFPVIGSQTVIDRGALLGDCTTLGDHVVIGRNVTSGRGLTVGNDTVVSQTVSFGTGVSLGSAVEIQRDVTFGSFVSIGDRTLIDRGGEIGSYVQCGTDVVMLQQGTIASGLDKSSPTIVPDEMNIPRGGVFPLP